MFCLTGSETSKATSNGLTSSAMFGAGSSYTTNDAERLFRKMVLNGVLWEELHVTAHESACCYLRLGPKASELMCGTVISDCCHHIGVPKCCI